MFSLLASLWRWINDRGEDYKVLVLGIDNAGKTTFVNLLDNELGGGRQQGVVVPTIGLNVARIHLGSKRHFLFWDVGGSAAVRPLWRQYFGRANCFLILVDCTDTDRWEDAIEALSGLLEFNGDSWVAERRYPIIVIANKTDISGSGVAVKMEEALKDRDIEVGDPRRGRPVVSRVIESHSIDLEGVQEVLRCLKEGERTYEY